MTSGLAYITALLVEGHHWTQELSYLLSPVLTVLLAGGALLLAGPRFVRLTAGRRAR